jgi:hypothetical protein
MSPSLVFTIANNAILPFWLLLIVAPRWRGTDWAVHSVAVPVVLGFAYLWLLLRLTWGGEAMPGSSFFSLAGVMALFASPVAVTMGWIHYLVFDLFVGAWIGRDAVRRAIPHWMVAPCLIVTLFIGPVGLLLYFLVRRATRRGGFLLSEG